MPGKVDKTSSAFIRRGKRLKASLKKLEKQIQVKIDSVEGVSEEALLSLGNDILNRSLEIVPVETGALKKSAFIEANRTISGPSVTLGYNKDGSAPHAVFAHEIGPYKKPTTPGTQYKFLEQPLHEAMPNIVETLKREISKSLRIK